MGLIAVIDPSDLTAAAAGPTALAESQHEHINALSFVRVRLRLALAAGGPVSVRPWYWRDGQWWPLRGDGATPSAGTAPVTADLAVFEGKAEGYFGALGVCHQVAIVTEDGSADDVQECYIDAVDASL